MLFKPGLQKYRHFLRDCPWVFVVIVIVLCNYVRVIQVYLIFTLSLIHPVKRYSSFRIFLLQHCQW